MDNVSHTHTLTHLKALRLWPKPSLEDVVVALLTADDVFLVLGLTSSEGKQTKQIDASLKRRWSSWGCCPTCLTCFCPSKNGFGGLVAKSILLQIFTLFWESIKDSHEQTASCVSQKAAPNLWNSHRPVLEEEQLWTPPRSNAARISNCCSQLVAKNPRNSPKCSGRSPPKLMTCKFGIFKTQVHFRSHVFPRCICTTMIPPAGVQINTTKLTKPYPNLRWISWESRSFSEFPQRQTPH